MKRLLPLMVLSILFVVLVGCNKTKVSNEQLDNDHSTDVQTPIEKNENSTIETPSEQSEDTLEAINGFFVDHTYNNVWLKMQMNFPESYSIAGPMEIEKMFSKGETYRTIDEEPLSLWLDEAFVPSVLFAVFEEPLNTSGWINQNYLGMVSKLKNGMETVDVNEMVIIYQAYYKETFMLEDKDISAIEEIIGDTEVRGLTLNLDVGMGTIVINHYMWLYDGYFIEIIETMDGKEPLPSIGTFTIVP